jgi:hypothetical protein
MTGREQSARHDPAEPCFKALDIEIENLSQWSADQDMTLNFEYDDRLVPSDQGPG